MPETMGNNEGNEVNNFNVVSDELRTDASYAIQTNRKTVNGFPVVWGRRNIKTFSSDQYLGACREVKNSNDILTDKMIEDFINRKIRQNGKLKVEFPTGWFSCPAIAFCTINGSPLDPDEVNIENLILDIQENTVSGFAPGPSNYAKILPAELRSIKFLIPPYEKEGPYDVTEADREKIETLARGALEKLKNEIKKYLQKGKK